MKSESPNLEALVKKLKEITVSNYLRKVYFPVKDYRDLWLRAKNMEIIQDAKERGATIIKQNSIASNKSDEVKAMDATVKKIIDFTLTVQNRPTYNI